MARRREPFDQGLHGRFEQLRDRHLPVTDEGRGGAPACTALECRRSALLLDEDELAAAIVTCRPLARSNMVSTAGTAPARQTTPEGARSVDGVRVMP